MKQCLARVTGGGDSGCAKSRTRISARLAGSGMESPNGRRPCTRLKKTKTCTFNPSSIVTVIVIVTLCEASYAYASHPTSYLLQDVAFDIFDQGTSLANHRHHLANQSSRSYDGDSHLGSHLSRTKRSVRPTKSYDYKESDGALPGAIQFQLDKKHPSEVFKIESPNRWVTGLFKPPF